MRFMDQVERLDWEQILWYVSAKLKLQVPHCPSKLQEARLQKTEWSYRPRSMNEEKRHEASGKGRVGVNCQKGRPSLLSYHVYVFSKFSCCLHHDWLTGIDITSIIRLLWTWSSFPFPHERSSQLEFYYVVLGWNGRQNRAPWFQYVSDTTPLCYFLCDLNWC
jgi:hypothetical protein